MRSEMTAWLFLSAGVTPLTGMFCLAQPTKIDSQTDKKPSHAAELTRTKLLAVKVSGSFKDARLGDILKEFASQVEMKSERPLLWTYGAGFPFGKRISFTIKEQPLEAILDQLFTQAGEGAGYVIVSAKEDKYDGWIRLTMMGERGLERSPPTAEDEATASERLVLAKKLIDAGKASSARPILEVLVRKYAVTKAGMEAMTLLEKIDK
jgi:hypothetical protein